MNNVATNDFITQMISAAPTIAASVNALIGSAKTRLGPAPEGDNAAAIVAVVERAVADLRPIPLLMPWGSKKPDNGTVDVAEVGGLTTLKRLQEAVQRVYPPGIDLIVRIEDLSGDYLFKDEGPEALAASAMYVRDFTTLVRAIGFDFITLKFETAMMDAHTYNALADTLRPAFFKYMFDSEGFIDDPSLESYQQLSRLGWKGLIPDEQREFYRSRYARANPSMSLVDTTEKLAGYFASILARIKLKGYGSEHWGRDFVNISFAPPVPGTPPVFAERRIYLRTLPTTQATTHIPPWRARGYLKMDGKTKLATFDTPLDLAPQSMIFDDGMGHCVTVRAPVLKE